MDENSKETQVRLDLLQKLNVQPQQSSIGARRAGIIGGRPDGTMSNPEVPPISPLQATHDAVQRIIQNETTLRHQLAETQNEVERLQRLFDAELLTRTSLETMIRQIAEIVVGSKAPSI